MLISSIVCNFFIHSRNYVVQYILDLHNQSATAILLSQFKGNYVELSMQKFSSNVVEKCLKVLDEDERAKIIAELLHMETFEQVLQDPYANYVIQSALCTTKVTSSKYICICVYIYT